MTYVKWWERTNKRIVAKGYICFATMQHSPTPDVVRYIARVDQSLDAYDVEKYIKTLAKFLPTLWSASNIITIKHAKPRDRITYSHELHPTTDGRYVVFTILSKGMNKHALKMMLTLFRYVDEFPSKVGKIASAYSDGITPDEALGILWATHDIEAGSGHMALGKYAWAGVPTTSLHPITHEKFLANLPNTQSVYGCFA